MRLRDSIYQTYKVHSKVTVCKLKEGQRQDIRFDYDKQCT